MWWDWVNNSYLEPDFYYNPHKFSLLIWGHINEEGFIHNFFLKYYSYTLLINKKWVILNFIFFLKRITILKDTPHSFPQHIFFLFDLL